MILPKSGGIMAFTLSKKFCQALKLSGVPAYRVAWQANIHPNTLSKLVSGYLRLKSEDPRLVKIGQMLGLAPEEVFEEAEKAA
jgi:hypothetical protein